MKILETTFKYMIFHIFTCNTGLITGIYEPGKVQLLETREDFDNFLKDAGSKLVVIHFYADWCGPCSKIKPKFAKMAEEFTDIWFAKVDADDSSEIAEEQGISAMPTFKFYKNGEKVDEFTGADGTQLKAKIENYK